MLAKVGAGTPRERELDGDAFHVSPTRVGVPVRPSLRTGIWLRCAKRKKNRQRGASQETSGPRPETVPGAHTILDGAHRTARAGPHLLTGIQGIGEG